MAMEESDDLPWEQLFDRADKVIQRTIESLPAPIRDQARKIVTLLEKWPPAESDADMLGQFHGFDPNHVSETMGPIFIFVGPLHDLCEEELLMFEDEVRITYLHELGHFLGMDEDDLDERGLG
jgi:predicted Zn-dependent protease with MMP-like domain